MIRKLQALIADHNLTAEDADPEELAFLVSDECPEADHWQRLAMIEQLVALLTGEEG